MTQTVQAQTNAGQDPIDFNRQIRPILSDRCYLCHGLDDTTNESGIRLDLESEAIDAGVWVPHEPDESTLVERIESDDPDSVMPPPDSNLTLSDEEKRLLRQWIQEGAKYDKHWAFKELPLKIDVPSLADLGKDSGQFIEAWKANPIDAFIAQQLARSELKPSPPATKQQWLRRVTFDLTGLPPTIDQIENFLDEL